MKLHINNSTHLAEFIHLNELWIIHYFELEPSDKELAQHPEKIMEEGGYVFSLTKSDKVVGVCALFNKGLNLYELARMTVHPDHRGEGLAHQLMSACFQQLKKIKAKKVYLISNTELKAAIKLYQQHGFITTHQGPHPDYQRADIVMEKNLQNISY
ncbi:GNAT family N-acetyltransferase [Marinicella gelatinilytica]|uniref:GNAT family N-acetyltransferase n=1 Tax=Marinicella gelatinilytica TaxID=2996017 RepID=UPI002260AE83|nr:GNAT family N-acetyltransferase [Marinicella gelatinilytica]MCX7546148.1 GNAT family N-acetyltransferase [Marinicella gelatinilytica]